LILPDDVFPTKLEYDLYVSSYRVRLFMAETAALERDVVLACLLRQIDAANEEMARLRMGAAVAEGTES